MLKHVRKNLSAFVIDHGLRGLSLLASWHPAARPERHGIRVTRDVAYGQAPHLRLDVYQPAEPNGVAVLYLHGGGFRILSKDTHWAMALSFARRGYTVFMPDYRLAPRHPFPAGLEDAAASLAWLHRHAERWGCNPQGLVLAGESAGGNFVTSLAVACNWERSEPFARRLFDTGIKLSALLPACAMLQVTEPAHRGTPDGWIRDSIARIGRDYLRPEYAAMTAWHSRELADVIVFLEQGPAPARPLPPLFAICGANDPIRLDTERLTPAWQRHGGEAGHVLYPQVGHAFHAFVWTAAARKAWHDQFVFLDRVLQR